MGFKKQKTLKLKLQGLLVWLRELNNKTCGKVFRAFFARRNKRSKESKVYLNNEK